MYIPQEERATVAVVEPPKRRRRIWIERTGTVAWVRDSEEAIGPDSGPSHEDEEFMRLTGTHYADGCIGVGELSIEAAFLLSVGIAQRYGWTMESLTATEAKLWKVA